MSRSGIALLAATAAALIWANVLPQSYTAIWHGDAHFVINEGLMTVFFFSVGLEIRREMHDGSLASLRDATLPLAAALGGMLVPAAIFAALNTGRAGAAGWAIPMATDIAFALGVLALLGRRVAPGLRILLLALAVIDDIGAIVVIAAFYSGGVAVEGLAIAAVGVAALLVMRRAGVRSPFWYVIPALIVWGGVFVTGVHPTIAGVLVGLLTPVAAAEKIEHRLEPWVMYAVMPIFALANAGVVLGGATLAGDAGWLFAGIVLGLALGKPLGIAAATLGAERTGVAARPDDVDPAGVVLVGLVGGIGFTMSLFIAQLAFAEGPLLETAKLAILVGSGAAILIAIAFGALRGRRR